MLELSKDLLTHLEGGGTVVVPSRQRAAAIRLAYSSARLRVGSVVWRTPDVISSGTWLERAAERVLRPAEEWFLWRSAARETLQEAGHPVNRSLVEALQRSARLLFEWNIPVATLRQTGDLESTLLADILQIVERRAAAMKALPSHRLFELMEDVAPRSPVVIAGFTEDKPWIARSLALREQPSDTPADKVCVVDAHDAANELERCAQWCREKLDEDPTRRLLVIVPDLAQRRHEVTRAFEQTLSPQTAMGEEREAALFAIEGGQPLADFPIVREALTTLRFLMSPLSFLHWSAWFRSAFWTGAVPAIRARIEAGLRDKVGLDIGAPELLAALRNVAGELAPVAQRLYSNIEAAIIALDAETSLAASPMQWSRRFEAALKAFGWPGTRSLTSAEQQTLARFQEILTELSALGPSVGVLRPREALRVIQDLARRSAFEPATGDPAVTLSSALTDPVVHYDGIWVTGLHADVWPRPASTDPFIPWAAQVQVGVTTVDPKRQLAQARLLMTRWKLCATELMLSWPKHDGDRELIASPLLTELASTQSESVEHLSPALSEQIRAHRLIETYDDAVGDPWPAAVSLPAGIRTLETQNLCPVRAYGELRLSATPLEEPKPGVDPRVRGMLLHRALQLLWDQLKDSAQLRAQLGPALDALIESSVARAITEQFPGKRPADLQRVLHREHRRATRLIRQLCYLESQRPPFTVHDTEIKAALTLSGAALSLRIDRIDALEDGTYAIFDYKTGAPQAQDWLGERVTHPQLLIYLMAAQLDVSTLANTHLTPARVGFRGIADRKGRLPRVNAIDLPPWKSQVGSWEEIVTHLAEDFLAGKATIDPLGTACRYCHLHAFCRIAAVPPVDEADLLVDADG